MKTSGEPELKLLLAQSAGFFNAFLKHNILPDIRQRNVAQLAEPMVYSLDAPGKRLRPVLCLWAAGVGIGNTRGDAGIPPDARHKAACYAAAAVEAIHTYSLIHDDLPAMDDDDLRRGRPACHRQFSEWAAILAGDALNTYAFELLAHAARAIQKPELLATLLPALSDGAGRMVCGQALDLETEQLIRDGGTPSDARDRLDEIHRKKTAALIRTSLELGTILAEPELPTAATARADFREFGEGLGLLFQIADDLLDVQADSAMLGKTAGKDAASGKLTYPAQYGIAESQRIAGDLQARLETLSGRLRVASPEFRRAFQMLPAYVAGRQS